MTSQKQIKLSQRQSVAWQFLENKITTEILYGGAAGGGKSKLASIWHIYRRTTYAGSRGLIGRAKIANLEQSTLVTLFQTASEMGYKSGVHFNYNQQKHIINWVNGSVTVLKDLFYYPSDPEFTSLGSTEYTDAIIDEAQEITRKAKEILTTRIRYRLPDYGLVPKLLLTCNPAPGWIKEDYISDENGISVKLPNHKKFIPALLSDNPNKEFKELYQSQLTAMSSDYDKQRLLFGNWDAKPDILNPFAHNFDRGRHIASEPIPMKKELPIYISIDFNLNPFGLIAAQIYTDSSGHHCHIVDEIEIKQGSISKMIEEMRIRYGSWIPSMQLTGDYSGSKRDIGQVDNASYYDQIQRALNMRSSQIKLYPNPTHSNSRADCNTVLYNFPDLKISPVCKNLIFDLQNVECDAFGSIIKRNRNELNQRADYLDCFRYLINAFMHDWIKRNRLTWK